MVAYNAFSSPGKALVAGGYLVIDPQYKAFVIALSTRIHAVIKANPLTATESEISTITINSPQFEKGTWVYQYNYKDISGTLRDVSEFGNNSFLFSTIETILNYAEITKNQDITIYIFSDPAYHSQNNICEKKSGKKTFYYHKNKINEVPKTGLGSSAGLVTALTAALLSHYKTALNLFSDLGLQTIHNLAQISHCIAQGKVGSGFDVAAATYGSIIYRRFDPEIINNLFGIRKENKSFVKQLREVVDTKWNMEITKCDLPPQIRILMGDINSGSETPKLVSKVLNWKKENPVESKKLFDTIDTYNMKLVSELSSLTAFSKKYPEEYQKIISYFDDYSLIQLKHLIKMHGGITTDVSNDELSQLSTTLNPILSIIESISSIRKNLQLLTKLTGAEIEPFEQTNLLDNCFTLPGVLGGVVPGAGGYDAICLVCTTKSVNKILELTSDPSGDHFNSIKKTLLDLSSHSQTEFDSIDLEVIDSKIFEKVTWLNLHEEKDGLSKEDITDYIDLIC